MRKYQEDSKLTTINTVVGVKRKVKGKSAVTLRDTVFFAGGGGQPADSGYIVHDNRTIAITRGIVLDKQPFMVLDLPFDDTIDCGDSLTVQLNAAERLKNSRFHTAEHLVCGCAESCISQFDLLKTEIAEDLCTIEFSGDYIPGKTADNIVAMANRAIADNLKVTVAEYSSIDKARNEFGPIFRSKVEMTGPLTMVIIDGLDAVPCGGTHIRQLSEIGAVELVSAAAGMLQFRI
jgi:Ser-tRNA(Ala) deacylase AlaX